MQDRKLEIDEAERVANYETVRNDANAEVRRELAVETARNNDVDRSDIEDVGARVHRNSVDEIQQTQNEIERGRVAARVSQVVDYIFMLVYGLLGIRLLLELFAARESAGFFRFIKAVTDPLYAPFRGLMPSPTTPEGFTLALPIIVAIVAYMLLHLAINGLLRMAAHRKVSI